MKWGVMLHTFSTIRRIKAKPLQGCFYNEMKRYGSMKLYRLYCYEFISIYTCVHMWDGQEELFVVGSGIMVKLEG